MLHQDDDSSDRSEVVVKLGDLGCCIKSTDTTNDYWQYCMTAFCMVTGEKFGARKYRKELEAEFVAECKAALSADNFEGELGTSLLQVPDIIKGVFSKDLCLDEVRDNDLLQ